MESNSRPATVYQLVNVYGVQGTYPTMDSAIAAKYKRLAYHTYWVRTMRLVPDATDEPYYVAVRANAEGERDCGY